MTLNFVAHLVGLFDLGWSVLILELIKPIPEHLGICTIPLVSYLPPCSSLTTQHTELRESITPMAGSGHKLASLISALFVLRLVTVRFLTASNVAFARSNHCCQYFEG